MKKNFLFGAMLYLTCTVSIQVNAQLEVNTSGNIYISKRVAINGANINDSIALNVRAPYFISGKGTYGVFGSARQGHPQHVSSGYSVGVLGYVPSYSSTAFLSDEPEQSRPSSPFYAAVVGVATKGVGIYGTCPNNLSVLPTTWALGNYASYFQGDAKVTGTLSYGQLASLLSDGRMQESVSRLANRNSIDILSLLSPISFIVRTDSITTSHYGFVAQEVKEIAPELVQEDGAGYLSMDYTELIPLLVQKVQELSAEVEELKRQQRKNL